MKRVFFLGLTALVFGACNFAAPKAAPTPTPTPTATQTPSPTEVMVPKRKTVDLAEQNNSGQTGTALLEDVEGKVKVTITMSGEKYKGAQPAHIHIGVCPGVGAVKYPLSNVVNGKSQTMLTISMADLISQVPLAINIHKSPAEADVYTACGGL